MAAGRRRARPALHVVGRRRSVGPGPLVRLGEHRAVRGARPRRPAGARLPARERGLESLAGGLPDPLPAMPYALVALEDRLFAGLANGELWESADRGDSWRQCGLRGAPLDRLVALAYVAD